MPGDSITETSGGYGGGDENRPLRNFKLNESTFLASLMPKKEIGADHFVEAHPQYDGRGVIIAIFDSGVDPAASGLQVTSDGKPKVLDVIDCTGSGDIDTSKVVKADADGCIQGASGASLVVNSSWKNPSGEWHVGYKFLYELLTDTLTSRLKKERKKKWDEKNQEEIAKAVKHLDKFNEKHSNPEEADLKRVREDLQARIDLLRKQADSYDDKGPVIDAVVWHDGDLWRAALDTQSVEDDSDCGQLANFVPLTNDRMLREEQRLATQHELTQDTVTEMSVAYMAQGRGRQRGVSVQCFNCKELGHIARNCSKKLCNYCKKEGHVIKECHLRPHNRQGFNVQSKLGSASMAAAAVSSPSTPESSSSASSSSSTLTPEVQQMLLSAFNALETSGSSVGEGDREGA